MVAVTASETAELDRRTDALLEAQRIEAYLPHLEAQAVELEDRLAAVFTELPGVGVLGN
jgi:hypothetical protein